MSLKVFNCAKCGICCKNIANIDKLSKYDNGQGVCKYLYDNKCLIYSKRPIVCNVKEYYFKKYKNKMSLNDFYLKNMEICIFLRNSKNFFN